MSAQIDLLNVPTLPTQTPPGDTPSWFTPLAWWLELERTLLRERLISGPFDADPFGHLAAPVTREILRRGGWVAAGRGPRADDGLTALWGRAVAWCNPPYDAQTLARALPKMVAEVAVSRAEVVALLPAWTDRAWWHATVEPARVQGSLTVRFLPGRLRFGWPENPTGAGADGAMFPSAVLVWPAGATS